MDNNIEIKIANITDPPEKMRLMYEAVSALIREGRELSAIKVSEITARAGIGKGTAYEYFSSKEELLSHALMYEYSNKIQKLEKSAFAAERFKDRCDRVMDWIRDNREYNLMLSKLLRTGMSADPGAQSCVSADSCEAPGKFGYEAHRYIDHLIDRFMEDAYKEGVITETDTAKRALAFFTAMVEYAFVIMGPKNPRYSHLGEENLRTFVYESMILALKGEVK